MLSEDNFGGNNSLGCIISSESLTRGDGVGAFNKGKLHTVPCVGNRKCSSTSCIEGQL
jgi:hypothetical protein